MVEDLISDRAYIRELLMELKQCFPETYGHCIRVANLTASMACNSEMKREDIERLYLCGLLHDIGKIKIQKEILEKKENLTDSEFKIIKQHPMEGYLMIKPYVTQSIAETSLLHHERLDGSGYPFGFRGDKIPFEAKLVMIVDAYDAMTVKRIYNNPVSSDAALIELNSLVSKYDKRVLDLLESTLRMGVTRRVRVSV